MLYFDRIDVSGGNDINKRRKSKECNIIHYWYFSNKGFKFQQDFCNVCHYLLMMSMNNSDITILDIKSTNYGCFISGISNSEAINLMQNMDLIKKS